MKTTILDVNENVPTSEDFIKDLEKKKVSIAGTFNNHNGTVNLTLNHHSGVDVKALVQQWNDTANESQRA